MLSTKWGRRSALRPLPTGTCLEAGTPGAGPSGAGGAEGKGTVAFKPVQAELRE